MIYVQAFPHFESDVLLKKFKVNFKAQFNIIVDCREYQDINSNLQVISIVLKIYMRLFNYLMIYCICFFIIVNIRLV